MFTKQKNGIYTITQKFGCVLVDPPWAYRNFSSKVHGAAAAHYNGLTPKQIASIPLASWTKDCSTLFLWGTWPQANYAHIIMRAWGYKYVTGFPWVKTTPSSGNIRRGVGFWTQGCSEYVLIGVKKKPQLRKLKHQVIGLLTDKDLQQVFYAPIPHNLHSAKPTELHEYIECRVEGPYLELFARRKREKWTCLGHDLGHHIYEHGVISLQRAVHLKLLDRTYLIQTCLK